MVVVKVSGDGTVPALPRALGAALGGNNELGIKTWSGAGSLSRHAAPSPYIPTLAAMIFIQ